LRMHIRAIDYGSAPGFRKYNATPKDNRGGAKGTD
jgi:hypothetical protein